MFQNIEKENNTEPLNSHKHDKYLKQIKPEQMKEKIFELVYVIEYLI